MRQIVSSFSLLTPFHNSYPLWISNKPAFTRPAVGQIDNSASLYALFYTALHH